MLTTVALANGRGGGMSYPYVFHWNRQGRKGQPCKVTARGALKSIRVEFADGFVMITSRFAVRKQGVAA
jgi:hypothetical protein